MAPHPHEQLTFRQERWRSACAGVLETAGNTFLLLIATREFGAGPVAKALVAAGGSVGLLISPLAVYAAQRLRLAPTRAVSGLLVAGATAGVLAAFIPVAWPFLYAVACVLALATSSAAIPLMTQVYQDNYPAHRRGKLYSRTFMLRIASAVVFAFLAGHWLDPAFQHLLPSLPAAGRIDTLVQSVPGRFRWLILSFAAAFAVAAWAVRQIPSTPLTPAASNHPFHALRYVREDRLFRMALISWMLMGFANLAMLPLRVEYLGNPRYGLSRSAGDIALLTLVIPNCARLLLSPVWGWLFDRMNFLTLRVTLNAGFALGIAAFFTSDHTSGLVLGAVIYGISNAGGDVAWGLWVTKFAPPARVADYMAVHTGLTGIRGVLAPLVAFQVVQHFSPAAMGWIAGALIAAASLILLPEIRAWGRR
jgi:hypothetical protein